MADYIFSDYLGDVITGFDVSMDVLRIDSGVYGSASSFSFNVSGADLVLRSAAGSVTLRGVAIREVTTGNVAFTDGSSLVMGDNTVGVTGDEDANTHVATSGNHSLWGFGGNDDLTVSGDGDAFLHGNMGNDTLTVSGNGNNTVRGGAGNESSGTGTGDAYGILIAGNGNNVVRGDTGDDRIEVTGSGNNVVYGDREFGSTGADVIVVSGSGNNTIYGGVAGGTADIDTITISGSGNNLAQGNTGDDVLTASGSGSNTLRGGSGDDTLNVSSSGSNRVYGDTGSDIISVSGSGSNVVYGDREFGETGNDTITISASGSNSVYGGVAGGTADVDTITLTSGATGRNYVQGNTGDDVISGSFAASGTGANWELRGGAGADSFTLSDDGNGAGGRYLLRGDTGIDSFNVSLDSTTAVTGVTLEGGEDADSYTVALTGAAHKVTLSDFSEDETLSLNMGAETATSITVDRSFSTTLTGTNGAAEQLVFMNFDGNLNATNLVLTDGTSIITNYGGDTATLTSGATADQLIAGDNGDTLVSGGGADVLRGGNGDDTFRFTGVQASLLNGLGANATVVGGLGTDTLELVTNAATIGSDDLDRLSEVERVLINANLSGFNITTNANIQTVDTSGVTSGANVTTLDTTGTTAITITGGAGQDDATISSGANNVNLGAGADDLTLTGALNGTLDGGAGSDVIHDVTGTANFNGTTIRSFETINVDTTSAVNLTVGAAYATYMEAGADLVITAAGAQALTLDASSYTGNMSVTGGVGADNVTLGSGDDTLSGGGGLDTGAQGGAGIDQLDDIGFATTIFDGPTVGGFEIVNIDTTANAVEFTLLAGYEGTLETGSDFTVSIAAGTNALELDASAFTSVNVVATGGVDDDTLIGGGGDDTLTGGDGTNELTGNAGEDVFIFTAAQANGTGNTLDGTVVAGGNDNDTIRITNDAAVTLTHAAGSFANITSVETLEITGNGAHTITLGASGVAAGITTIDVSGSATGATIDASDLAAGTILGGSGDDQISIGSGASSVSMGLGDDTVNSSLVADLSTATIHGGSGGIDGSGDYLGTVSGTVTLDGTNITGFENIYIANVGDDDILTLTAAYEATLELESVVDLGSGPVVGLNGAIFSTGSGGSVKIDISEFTSFGMVLQGDPTNPTNDTLIGGGGDDILAGILGTDSLTGGGGSDKFAVVAPLSVGVITDFTTGSSGDAFWIDTVNGTQISPGNAFGNIDTANNVVIGSQAVVEAGVANDHIFVITDAAGYADYATAEAVIEAQGNTTNFILIFWDQSLNGGLGDIGVYYDPDSTAMSGDHVRLFELENFTTTDLANFHVNNFDQL